MLSKHFPKFLLGLFLCLSTLLMQSCAKHTPKPFYSLQKTGITKNNVTVSAQELSRENSEYYFNANVTKKSSSWFTEYPAYQAVQVAIKNNSGTSYSLDTDSINAPLASYHDVSEKIYTLTRHNLPLWFFFGGILIWLPCLLANNNLAPKITEDLEGRTLESNTVETIDGYDSLTKFLFVPKDIASSSLSIELTNKQNGEKTVFDLDLE